MIGGKIIKDLKLAYNDIFGKNAKDYWKDEGNNKRMQFYYKVVNKIDFIQTVLTIILLMLIAYLVTKTIVTLVNGFDICTVVNCSEVSKKNVANNIYLMIPMTILMVVNLGVCRCIRGYIRPREFYKYVYSAIMISPLMYLLYFGMSYKIVNFILVLLTFVLYILITCICNTLYTRVIELYNIATGKNQVLNTAEEVTEYVDVNKEIDNQVVRSKKMKKERKRK